MKSIVLGQVIVACFCSGLAGYCLNTGRYGLMLLNLMCVLINFLLVSRRSIE